MGSKLLDHVNKFTSSDSILVSTKSKGLVRLYCPFKVTVIQSVDSFTVGDTVEVVKVKISQNLKLVYIINGRGYYHYHFSIEV